MRIGLPSGSPSCTAASRIGRCPLTLTDPFGGAFHRKHGLRIDFLLGTPATAEITRNVVIDRDYRKKKDGLTASDHAPVFADLDL